tara:strand:+ start:524 stop:1138 length:615 start_codon:yes stop_codon:yes gene_type:complete
MIQINLLSEKKKKAIPVPIGGIIMILWIVVNLGGLYYGINWCENQEQLYVEEKGIARLEREVSKLAPKQKRVKRMRTELQSVEQALSDYQGILSKKMGSWTKILHRFEEFVARAKTVWIQQLRIDADGQVQLNGVSMEAESSKLNSKNKKVKLVTQGVTDLVSILQQEVDFVRAVTLSQVNHDLMDKKRVAKFDLTFIIMERNI